MSRINEFHVFFASIFSAVVIFAIEFFNIEVLADLQIVFGIYLIFIPVGYLFFSVIQPFSSINSTERLLLSMVLSISIISITLLIVFYLFLIPLNFLNNLLTLTGLCVLFFAAYLLEKKFNVGIKPPETKL